jgi:hypothetical protein
MTQRWILFRRSPLVRSLSVGSETVVSVPGTREHDRLTNEERETWDALVVPRSFSSILAELSTRSDDPMEAIRSRVVGSLDGLLCRMLVDGVTDADHATTDSTKEED